MNKAALTLCMLQDGPMPRCALCGSTSIKSAWVVGKTIMGHCCFPSAMNRSREFWLMPDGIYTSRIHKAPPREGGIWKWPGFADLACKATLLQVTKGEPLIPRDAFLPVGDVFPLIRMTWRLPDGSYRLTTHGDNGSCVMASPCVVPQYPVWRPPTDMAVTLVMGFKVDDVSDDEDMADRGGNESHGGATPWYSPLSPNELSSPASPDQPDSSFSPTSPDHKVPPGPPPVSPAYDMLIEALSDLSPQPLVGRLLNDEVLPKGPRTSPS
ncbi:uncharacterized protein LOC127587825 [Hippocampus zosterae]|uniref:uncharacterized protein LOC127587825 n=1 Tax=Hippocampus zosterae TaxID=109293 RepID=UPI00223DDC0E|nr:uncharacterized protein LOC127587825 [Hippocampus zosterae]XP_051902255.1 uncharacterized protein LOC127587825 [Hippocampus zosterae]XP_051902256.1 uncharacterized protein LOC127587825 [Hippocampus zosterae]XP_051902257.1 uncharacterized protein LOC127587825 [Hippocampus zosterae]XP_051902258.1 uncharacterized protein LOC127587825 [Hippocampus zosterae]XP_051902259.1 uncharacterized protein LOC127587825 [Hippocampus zosterae]XP_051902260.1 uncharacterized protein LOC127587825 [Hippocampus 